MQKRTNVVLAFGLLAALVAGTGCSSGAGNGAVIGGASGAGLGAIIGNNSHGRTLEGALIGGAIGTLAGAAIGDSYDRDQRQSRHDDRYYDDSRRGGGVRYERYETRRYEPCPSDYYEYRDYRGYRGGYTEYREYRRY
ncbi:glycine zipper domain-containing protein [Humisphaera borealis]|uniref:Glycine zipper domain-containing protein n=1 Tax=Humisphaera borealis TaxID=2807512 RepID=A0A7M2X2Z3_9BACT|nr:glycine zipper domain-containing protein [Humisphaera borealis]QOV92128.1 hypothetical protein IPV69_12545 [Humisphaera borealis]